MHFGVRVLERRLSAMYAFQLFPLPIRAWVVSAAKTGGGLLLNAIRALTLALDKDPEHGARAFAAGWLPVNPTLYTALPKLGHAWIRCWHRPDFRSGQHRGVQDNLGDT